MKRRLKLPHLVAAGCLLAQALLFPLAPAFAQQAPSGSAEPAKTAETPARGVMWEVRSGDQRAYLFGSIHLAKAGFYPLPDQVQAAYQQADTLAVEIDASDASVTKRMMPLLTYKEKDKLEKHLKPATWQKLQKLTGPAAERLQTLKPAVVASALVIGGFARLGYDPKQGVDLHFIERAKEDKKPLVELESAEFQAKVLGGLSDGDGDALLAETLDGMANGQLLADTNTMIGAWKEGDARALAKILDTINNKDAGSRRITRLMLDDRNPAMADKIAALLKDGKRPMVVVGAMHMTGKNSLLVLLQKKGFEVHQVELGSKAAAAIDAAAAPASAADAPATGGAK